MVWPKVQMYAARRHEPPGSDLSKTVFSQWGMGGAVARTFCASPRACSQLQVYHDQDRLHWPCNEGTRQDMDQNHGTCNTHPRGSANATRGQAKVSGLSETFGLLLGEGHVVNIELLPSDNTPGFLF